MNRLSFVFTRRLSGLNDARGMGNCKWILHQWRGTRIGLEPFSLGKWTTFDDTGFGLVRHGHKYNTNIWSGWKVYHTGTHVIDRPTPHMADTYTIEIGAFFKIQIINMKRVGHNQFNF